LYVSISFIQVVNHFGHGIVIITMLGCVVGMMVDLLIGYNLSLIGFIVMRIKASR